MTAAIDRILERLPSAKPSGDGSWLALCPAHDDTNPSLSVTKKNGRALLHCFAGCSVKAIVAALGLEERDLFDNPAPRKAATSKSRSKKIWPDPQAFAKWFARKNDSIINGGWFYQDIGGDDTLAVLRFDRGEKKSFRPLHRVDGGWSVGDPAGSLPLYNLPQLMSAPHGTTVYVVEGEKCCEEAATIGLLSTTSAHGARDAGRTDWHPLKNQDVVLLPDNDKPGAEYASTVARHLTNVAASVKIVKLPGLLESGDIADFVEKFDSRESEDIREGIEALVVAAPLWIPPAENDDDAGAEVGLTKRLADSICIKYHFAQDGGGLLYVFKDGLYQPSGKNVVRKEVKHLLAQWGQSKKWSSYRSGEVVEYIRVDAPLLWEQPPTDTLNLTNGLLDIETRTLRPHDPEFLSQVQLPVSYDPTATCPAWEKFISEVFPEDAQQMPWQLVASMMLPHTALQKAVLLLGEGSNGKSTFLSALSAFIGQKNLATLALHKLEADRFGSARLVGKLANICPDLPSEHLASTSVFKAITGGDTIAAERKYADGFDFVPFCRMVFSANHAPRSHDASHAFFRRWLVIPFTQTFEGKQEIPRNILDARLAAPAEFSGVLNRALEALPDLRRTGFTEPLSSQDAWREFRKTTDPLGTWLDANTVSGPDLFITKNNLLAAYQRDAKADGRPPATAQGFGRALKRLRPDVEDGQRTIDGKVVWIYQGIALRED